MTNLGSGQTNSFVKPKIFFGLPCYSYREAETNETIKDLLQTKENWTCDTSKDIYEIIGLSSISKARNDIATAFLKSDCDYLFFLDSDQVWIRDQAYLQQNAIDIMVTFDRDIVSPPIVSRIQPIRTLWVPFKNDGYNVWQEGKGLLRHTRIKPFEVEATGTGFTLIRRNVVEKVIEKYPAPFMPMYCEKLHTETSDDIAFIRRARELGFKCYVQPGIKIGHIGKYPFSPDEIKDFLIKKSRE
jgi:hypothetical protein